MKKPRVEFRAEQGLSESKPESWVPVIAFILPDGDEIKFICSGSFPKLEHAKDVCNGAYAILTSEQNVKIDDEIFDA